MKNDSYARCVASAFTVDKIDRHHKTPPMHQQLYRDIEQYFSNGSIATSEKVCRTSLPPIYLQHPGTYCRCYQGYAVLRCSHPTGHSLTIVGLEKRKSGAMNLLVFDPMFKPSPGVLRLVDTRFRVASPEKLLKAYRRGDTYLEKHKCFELLKYLTTILFCWSFPNTLQIDHRTANYGLGVAR